MGALHGSWATGRPEPFVSLAKGAAANEGLSVKLANRLSMRLTQAGRWSEAAEILHDPRYRLLDTAAGQMQLAQVSLGLGRLREAATAAVTARERGASYESVAREIETQVGRMRTLQAAARSSGTWPGAQALIEAWLDLDAPEPAGHALMTFLASGIKLVKAQRDSFHLLLDILVSLRGSFPAYPAFRAMEHLSGTDKATQDLRVIVDGLFAAPAGPVPELPVAWRTGNARLHLSGALAWGAAGRLEAAIDALGGITEAYPRQSEFRPLLQRVVGEDMLRRRPLTFAPPGPVRRVFDVFPFNNELRMLKLKLNTMTDWVDGFVIVEARQTFTGAPKPLVFEQNKEQFAEFASKIIHVVVDAFPPYVRHAWAREYHQRDMGVAGLDGRVSEDDLVIISDTDEIVSPAAVQGFDGEFARLGMERLRYFMNYRQALPRSDLKDYASLWRARYLGGVGLSTARDTLRFDKTAPRLSPSGWHFTSIGDASAVRYKMDSTSHQEHAGVPVDAIGQMLERIRAGEHDAGWERVKLNWRFPAYLLDHSDEFEDVLL